MEKKKGTPPVAGRPAKYPGPMRARMVTLDEATILFMRKLGRGNVSAGIREAAGLLSAKKPASECAGRKLLKDLGEE